MRHKAGFIPYIKIDNEWKFMFMIPSDPKFGGPLPNIAKGGIDKGEEIVIAGIREAIEELGLKKKNIKKKTVVLAWEGIFGGEERCKLTVFAGEIKDISDFDEPHYETKSVCWLSEREFAEGGRKNQAHIVTTLSDLLS